MLRKVRTMTIKATRLLDHPIIYPHMDDRMGDNINGPAIIRMPDWASGKLGKYHLYFSDHRGTYLRMAFAEDLLGPWVIHSPGVMSLEESLYITEDPPEPPVEDRPPWAKLMVGGYLYAHIASPDIHIDEENKCFHLYYHGLLANGDQLTRYACSEDGLTFTPRDPLLGPPYFRAFQYKDHVYTITWGGKIWRAPTWEGPFEPGPKLIPYKALDGIGEGFRHGEVHVVGQRLHIFYTRMGDRPESILHASLELSDDWMNWTLSEPSKILEPELDWEGADLPLETSVMGATSGRARELRDPCVFVDEGVTYLLYCGAGEAGFGIAKLEGL